PNTSKKRASALDAETTRATPSTTAFGRYHCCAAIPASVVDFRAKRAVALVVNPLRAARNLPLWDTSTRLLPEGWAGGRTRRRVSGAKPDHKMIPKRAAP